MRPTLVFLHRWLALITGVLVLLVAVSGAVVVFEQPLSEANVTRVTVGAHLIAIDSLANLAVAAAGGGSVDAVGLARAPNQAYGFQIGRDTTSTLLMVDPYTGQVLGPPSDTPWLLKAVSKVHRFHVSLLAGDTGKAVVGLVALSSLLLVLVGLMLWRRDRLWRIHWSASWKRIFFDLHHSLGVLAALILLIVTATGVWIAYPKQIDPLVLRLDPPAAASIPLPEHVDSDAVPVSLDSLIRSAHGVVPDAPVLQVMRLHGQPAMVFLRYPEDHTPGGRSRVFLDGTTGSVIRFVNTRTAGTGTKLRNLQRALHTGDAFGTGSRIIWFLASLILASQVISGTLMWWNGRAARRARAAASA